MSVLHDLIERITGWERIRGNQIPDFVRIGENLTTIKGKNSAYDERPVFFTDNIFEYRVDKKLFAPTQGLRIPRRWTYRRKL